MIEYTDILVLTVSGPPKAQMRARAAAFGKHARVYKHEKQIYAETSFIAQILPQLPAGFTPFTGPLAVDFYFYIARPKSHFGTGRNAGNLKPNAPRYPTVKPDFDNTIKHVCDVLNHLAWDDDKQICRATVHKGYTKQPPITRIFIKELDNAQAG